MTRVDRVAPGSDRGRTHHAAVRVGLWVGLSSAAIVGLIAVVTIVVLVTASRDEQGDGHRGGRFNDRVVSVGDLLPLIVVLGLAGVVALAVIAWYAARRATAPLAEALRIQRAFVADASHELRTPLTTLTSRIQLAEHRLERGGDVRGALAQLRADADTMDATLTDLLLAAESAGSPSTARSTETCSVADAAHAAAETMAPTAAAKSITLLVDGEDARAAIERIALTRALRALLDNAITHSPPGAPITIGYVLRADRVEVRVSDRGRGIPAADQDRVFDRFARSDTGGTKRGFGLGLALVREVADRFGGSVRVESSSPAGTTMLLELPSADPTLGDR
ncbi:sensor histidine kinase [Microbacterium sp. CJ88]|uniref:sensor histidine kinase n=1 Tax=Microbacterium sp. CJ88 TaxID=3445672 RepID=UPI003F65E0BD